MEKIQSPLMKIPSEIPLDPSKLRKTNNKERERERSKERWNEIFRPNIRFSHYLLNGKQNIYREICRLTTMESRNLNVFGASRRKNIFIPSESCVSMERPSHCVVHRYLFITVILFNNSRVLQRLFIAAVFGNSCHGPIIEFLISSGCSTSPYPFPEGTR